MNDADDIILFASSQGTATAINYVACYPYKIKALILESILASGNSAISHTFKNFTCPILIRPIIKYLPYSYYWLPYLAKLTMPFYNPGGLQAIFSIEYLPKDIPIIIIHSLYDEILPYSDAQAIYAGLRNLGNSQSYLMTYQHPGHVCLLRKTVNRNEIKFIKTILSQDAQSQELLQECQPDFDNVIQHYNELRLKEKNTRNIAYGVNVLAIIAFFYNIYSHFA